MEFDNPEVIKSFPGLYVSEHNKKINSETDYSEEGDNTATKKELQSSKKKKEKKDKDRGYAALEGESSAEEICDAGSSKSKKNKAFKFATKSKEKREKSREKDVERKRDKEKKGDKDKLKLEKKDKKLTKSSDECTDIADGLPIFGVALDLALERSRCHDGIDIPAPVRMCIDYVQRHGLGMENVYKVSGPKSKVLQLKRLMNQRVDVMLQQPEHDVPTVTSLLKMYLRDLPEPLFTTDLLVRFEEAGAILNVATREKHLKILIEHLPANNRLLLAWLITHFDNIVTNERVNKMNAQALSSVLNSTLHTSTRLFGTLLHHCRSVFPGIVLDAYIPPLPDDSGCRALPDDPVILARELEKQESLLNQLHTEINAGYACKEREERLWEVQRIITQLKRKTKNAQKERDPPKPANPPAEAAIANTSEETVAQPQSIKPTLSECQSQSETEQSTGSCDRGSDDPIHDTQLKSDTDNTDSIDACAATAAISDDTVDSSACACDNTIETPTNTNSERAGAEATASLEPTCVSLKLLQLRQRALQSLHESLKSRLDKERLELGELQGELQVRNVMAQHTQEYDPSLEHVMGLLAKENQILQIKKISLVRQIIEQQEICVNLQAKIAA